MAWQSKQSTVNWRKISTVAVHNYLPWLSLCSVMSPTPFATSPNSDRPFPRPAWFLSFIWCFSCSEQAFFSSSILWILSAYQVNEKSTAVAFVAENINILWNIYIHNNLPVLTTGLMKLWKDANSGLQKRLVSGKWKKVLSILCV